MLPAEACPGQQDHQIERDQGQQKIDADKETLGKGEDVLRHIDLVDEREIGDDRAHTEIARLAEIVEPGQPDQQIGDVADTGRGKTKDIGKHQRQHAHRQQRIQQAPGYAQYAALVFHLEIAQHELPQQKTVAPQGKKQITDK